MLEFKKALKTWIKVAMALILMTGIVLSLAFCTVKTPFDVEGKKQDFFALELSELETYITVGTYKGLNITQGEKAKDEVVWGAIASASKVQKYPEEHVYYYVDQFKGQYRYYAEQAGMSYEDMLAALGISEADILERSKEMTKKDILIAIIAKRENIVVTDEEKASFFDKYVNKYVSEYGYNVEYVTENMAEQIYSSMLYDKITEFLILNNNLL